MFFFYFQPLFHINALLCSKEVIISVSPYRVESVIDNMLEILAHPNLPHQLVFVTVHPSQLSHVGEDVLQAVRQLKGVHIAETILDVAVDHQFGQTQDLPAKMEGIAETGLLSFLNIENNQTC